jgi:hypothetical protein
MEVGARDAEPGGDCFKGGVSAARAGVDAAESIGLGACVHGAVLSGKVEKGHSSPAGGSIVKGGPGNGGLGFPTGDELCTPETLKGRRDPSPLPGGSGSRVVGPTTGAAGRADKGTPRWTSLREKPHLRSAGRTRNRAKRGLVLLERKRGGTNIRGRGPLGWARARG